MITVQPYIKSFHVSFTPSSEYDVVYYKVHATHVDNFVNGDFIPSENNLINEGPETSLLHQVDKGGVWGVKITAVDTFGEDIPNYSGLVTCTVATLDPLDTTAPNVPVFSTLVAAEETGVESAAVTPNIFIKLAWTLTPVPEDFGTFVLAYKRHTATDWNEQLTEGYSHVFTNMIAGLQYDFKIKAVDKWNNDSAFSAVKTITAAADTVAPSAPTGVTVTPSFGSIRLAWVSPTDLDLKHINVYRNTVNNSSTATKIVSAYGTSYTDAGLLTGTTYYYWLKSEDYSGNVSAAFSSVVSGAPIQIMPTDLDITARVDFVVKDSIFQFTAGTTTLTFTNGSIIRGSSAYTITAGSVANAHNSYVVATLSGSTATISVTPMIGEFPTLTSSQVIIALTSSAPLAGTTNYACYVRQSNSMAIEGAIIRDATITTAKIKDLTADKIGTGTLAVTEYIGVNDDQIKLGNIGTGVTGILIRNLAKTEDVFKVDSTGTATLKNILIDGSVTLGESKILLDGTNSRITVANASNKNVVTVGKLATGKYGINIKDASEASVLRVDEDGAVIQNLTSGSIDAAKVTIDNLVVGSNVTMGPNAYIAWDKVTSRPNTTYIGSDGIYTGTLAADQISTGTITSELVVVNSMLRSSDSSMFIDAKNKLVKLAADPSNYVQLTPGELSFVTNGVPYSSVKRILSGVASNNSFVVFDPPFKTTPRVICTIKKLKVYESTLATLDHAIEATPQNVGPDGFTAIIKLVSSGAGLNAYPVNAAFSNSTWAYYYSPNLNVVQLSATIASYYTYWYYPEDGQSLLYTGYFPYYVQYYNGATQTWVTFWGPAMANTDTQTLYTPALPTGYAHGIRVVSTYENYYVVSSVRSLVSVQEFITGSTTIEAGELNWLAIEGGA